MTLEQNITAILETYFCGFRSELIEACAKRIMEQIESQADTPQTDRPCDKCEWHKEYGRCIFEYCHYEYEQAHKDTPQTEDYDFRDEQEYNDRWDMDCDRYVITNDEGDKAYNCMGCTQTDCGWR